MQRNPERTGPRPPKRMHVPNLRFVYDAIVDGRVTVGWKVEDLSAVSAVDVPLCACPWGACVASVTGGDVTGYDYLGQRITETVGAAGTSEKAFAYIDATPADALWTNTYGLPYLASGTTTVEITGDTTTITTGTDDARGVWSTDAAAGDVTEFSYPVDITNLHGNAYADFATGAMVAETTFAGTVNSAGAIAITKTLIADSSAFITLTFPDGGTVRTANAAAVVNYTLSPLWMSKYKTVADIDTIVSGATEAGSSIAVNLTGSLT